MTRKQITLFASDKIPCGGLFAGVHLANALSEIGVDATVAFCSKWAGRHVHPPIKMDFDPLVYDGNDDALRSFPETGRLGVYVNLAVPTIPVVRALGERDKEKTRSVAWIQGQLLDIAGRHRPDILEYYQWPHRLVPSATTARHVAEYTVDGDTTILPVGVNGSTFFPRDNTGRPVVVILLRADLRQRNLGIGIRVATRLAAEHGNELEIHAVGYGCPESMPPPIQTHGEMGQSAFAELLGRANVLLDPTTEHGFGLPAMEAIASGCWAVCPDSGAASEYRRWGHMLYEWSGDRARSATHAFELVRSAAGQLRPPIPDGFLDNVDWRSLAVKYLEYFDRLWRE